MIFINVINELFVLKEACLINMEDILTKATIDGVRIYALTTTNLVREVAKSRRAGGRQCAIQSRRYA